MTLGTILLIVIVLLVVGALPRWPHSRNWGYIPSGILVAALLLILLLMIARAI